jgi:hydroxymethylbilane synthase
MDTPSQLQIGSRKTPLALAQTALVINALKSRYPSLDLPVVTMSTMGDDILHLPLSNIGEKGLFTKELEWALHNHQVDVVVHSLKDMPTTLPEGMFIAAVLQREDPRDVLILHPRYQESLHIKNLASLPANSVIGTSSLRRTSQLRSKYPHLIFKTIVSIFLPFPLLSGILSIPYYIRTIDIYIYM